MSNIWKIRLLVINALCLSLFAVWVFASRLESPHSKSDDSEISADSKPDDSEISVEQYRELQVLMMELPHSRRFIFRELLDDDMVYTNRDYKTLKRYHEEQITRVFREFVRDNTPHNYVSPWEK